MQGQQPVAGSSAVGASSSTTAVNASATGVSTSGNEKTVAPTNRSNTTPPPTVVPATNTNGPGENDAMHSLDEQTAISGDSMNKDRS